MGTGTANAAPETQFEDASGSKNINPRECAIESLSLEVMALRINACESGSPKIFLYVQLWIFFLWTFLQNKASLALAACIGVA